MSQAVMTEHQVAGMPREFWEDDLEISLDHEMRRVTAEGYLDAWLRHRTGRQLTVLCQTLEIDGGDSTQKQRKALREADVDLLPYVLMERFAQRKSKVAVADFAERVLAPEMLEIGRVKETEFDTVALMFAVFDRNPTDLRLIYHLDRIHKNGFARMRLETDVRQSEQTLEQFLSTDALTALLAAFDQSRTDGLTSELRDVIEHHGRHLVFVRRGERPNHLVSSGGEVMHGYNPEWIILDFEHGAKRVNISSVSPEVPLEIANRIATAYFGKTCEYANEHITTYPKQVERFLNQIRDVAEGELVLVEVALDGSPLEGSPKLLLSDTSSIGPALAQLESMTGPFLDDIDQLNSIKVLYRKKRVSLIFEAEEGGEGYVVRYSDHRLNGLQRPKFEALMEVQHGIAVLSTEKRFKKPS